MRSNDLKNYDDVRAALQQAIKDNDSAKFAESFDSMLECLKNDMLADYDEKFAEMTESMDQKALASRGIRQLTSEEKEYYQKFAEVIKARNPRQALENVSLIMPETVINAVLDELQTNHPLLSKLNFIPTGAAIKMLVNTNGYQEAAWGELCAEIVTELTGGFKVVNTNLLKLSAFLPVCKQALDLGPVWLDRYVRGTLYEALANGLEAGIIAGDGDDAPIGMNRQVGAGVSVVDGAYPEKEAIAVTALNAQTIGNLLSLMAVDENGKTRQIRDLIMIVNPADYFGKIMPAVLFMGPDGTYRNSLPYDISIIQSPAVDIGSAIFGMGYRYFAAVGSEKEGRIDYSDHVHFLEDERVYIIKAFATGMPLDNNAFQVLDISGLAPTPYKVEVITPEPSDDATLASLKIGSLELDPDFDPDEDEYEAATTNATNIITAVPADAGATVAILNGSTVVPNGTAATWAAGENTVTIVVTAADGTTQETYTVTVTKS